MSEVPTVHFVGGRRVDPYRSQPLWMSVTLIRIDDMNRLIAALESVLNEWKQHAILFVVAVEECTDVTRFGKLRASKTNRRRDRPHGVFLLHEFIWISQATRVSSFEIVRTRRP